MRSFLLLIGFLSLSLITLAQTPTQHSDSLEVNVIGCDTIDINWIVGNGSYRLVVIDESDTVSFVPDSGTYYFGTPRIGSATIYAVKGDSLALSGLKKATDYLVYIYEFDFGTRAYYTDVGYPIKNFTTEDISIVYDNVGHHVCEGEPINYTANVSQSNGKNTILQWKLDTFHFSNNNFDYTYASYGIFNNSLFARALGCSDTVYWKDTVAPVPRMDFFLHPDTPRNNSIQCLLNNRFYFENKTINPYLGTSTDKAIVEWDFGDGDTEYSYRARHSYGDTGVYDVRLKILTTKQNSEKVWCIDSLTKSVRVIASPDPNDIEIKYEYLEQGDSLKFSYNQSDFNYWIMGDTIWSTDSFVEMNNLGIYNLQLVSNEICRMDWDIEVISLAPGGFLGAKVQELDQDNNDEVSFELPEAPEYLWSSGETMKSITIRAKDTAVGTYKVWGESRYNPDLSISDTITLNVVKTASIDDIKNINQVYPNPAQHFVSLNLAQASSYSLLDIHGNEVLGSDLKLMNHKLELDSLPQGIYFLRVNNGTAVQTIKLIKN